MRENEWKADLFLSYLFPIPSTYQYNRIVIVLDQSYRKNFAFLQEKDPRIVFADPGKYVCCFSSIMFFWARPFCFVAGLPLFHSRLSPLPDSVPPFPIHP